MTSKEVPFEKRSAERGCWKEVLWRLGAKFFLGHFCFLEMS